jgi:hypothetical protein
MLNLVDHENVIPKVIGFCEISILFFIQIIYSISNHLRKLLICEIFEVITIKSYLHIE